MGDSLPAGFDTISFHVRPFEEIDMTDQHNEKSVSTILIAEDEAILAEDIGISLENLGYSVAGKASTGEGAVNLARESKPDLILMDIKLQGDIDGIDAADRIRTFLDIPVVYLTGYQKRMFLREPKRHSLTDIWGSLCLSWNCEPLLRLLFTNTKLINA